MSAERMSPRTKSGRLRSTANIANPHARRWYERLYRHTPPWVTYEMVAEVYNRARRMRDHGADVEVDHIIPLGHPLMCGLHVPANWQIISKSANAHKSNNYFPGHPQLELLGDPFEPEQYSFI